MKQLFKGKKVAILGLSTEGLDSAKFFLAEGARVHCCDRRSEDELGEAVSQLKNHGVELHLGPTYLRHTEQFDLLVRTPGMALFLPLLQTVHKKGKVTSLTRLFFDLCPAPIIGVTGTKGKGTTTTLIGKILQTSGFKTHIGGNIGVPLLSAVRNIHPSDRVVLELSSFQLEDITRSPHIAVVLNITSDHLANADPLSTNFHQNIEAYVDAKKNIVRYQTKEDYCIVNADYEVPRSFNRQTKAAILEFSRKLVVKGAYVQNDAIYLNTKGKPQVVCQTGDLMVRGEHNLENITGALVAVTVAGGTIEAAREVVPKFKGLEHRLEFVCETNGVKYYNDSFSTTPETAIAAIRSFSEPIILIAGGSEKNSDYTELGKVIVESSVKTLILIGHMAGRIEEAVVSAAKIWERPAPPIFRRAINMEEIVTLANNQVSPGDVVLLSPACASFDMFKNYKERGSLFKKYAQKITG